MMYFKSLTRAVKKWRTAGYEPLFYRVQVRSVCNYVCKLPTALHLDTFREMKATSETRGILSFNTTSPPPPGAAS
jgi:hypothetical protein